MVVGYKLIRISLYKEMYQKGRWRFVPFIVTVLALVFTDMLTGVILGLAVGFFHILLLNYKMDYLLEKGDNKQFTLTLSEHITFLNKASVLNVLRVIPPDSRLIIDFSRTEVIDDFNTRAQGENIDIVWRGRNDSRDEKDLWEIKNE